MCSLSSSRQQFWPWAFGGFFGASTACAAFVNNVSDEIAQQMAEQPAFVERRVFALGLRFRLPPRARRGSGPTSGWWLGC